MTDYALPRNHSKTLQEAAEREAKLYGSRHKDMILLRQRGYGVHVEPAERGRRFRVGNRLISGEELSLIAARERRLLKHARKGN